MTHKFEEHKDHDTIATLVLNGSPIRVGTMYNKSEETIFFQTDENVEPVYIGIKDTKLLIAAFQSAISNLKELD